MREGKKHFILLDKAIKKAMTANNLLSLLFHKTVYGFFLKKRGLQSQKEGKPFD